MRNIESVTLSHSNKFWIQAKNILDATADLETNAFSTNKCLTPNIVFEEKVSNETKDIFKRYPSRSETSFK